MKKSPRVRAPRESHPEALAEPGRELLSSSRSVKKLKRVERLGRRAVFPLEGDQ
jgi:hypothetical protein